MMHLYEIVSLQSYTMFSHAASRIGGQIPDHDPSVPLTGGQIPDAAMIHLIRKKRQQMAREMTEEFIPVDDKVKDTSTSRLIR